MLKRRSVLAASVGALSSAAFPFPGISQKLAHVKTRQGSDWQPSEMMIATGFFQEDVDLGPVSEHTGRGIVPYVAAQLVASLKPVKAEPGAGVRFLENTGSHLLFRNVTDSAALYKWCLSITRMSDQSVPNNTSTQFVSVNEGAGINNRHPRQVVTKNQPVTATTTYGGGRGNRADLTAAGYVADDATWNSILSYRRDGKLYMSVNGIDSGFENDDTYWAWGREEKGPSSIIGTRTTRHAGWAYDAIIFGQGELTEAQVRKIEGWAHWRVGQPGTLPLDHPFRTNAPLVEGSDFPQYFQHNDAAWRAWGNELSNATTGGRMGQARLEDIGYERVFFDDFRVDSVGNSAAPSRTEVNWFAPGWNTSVGQSARLLTPGKDPDVYAHAAPVDDGGVTSGGSLALSLKYKNGWNAACITSVNDAGYGRYWSGGGIFRLRCMFPKLQKPAGGFFPAFWAYGRDSMVWRHVERFELDFWEFDGKNDKFLNGGSAHVHKGQFGGRLGHLLKDSKNFEIWDGELTRERLGTSSDFHLWDGEWHTWEFRIDRDFSYLNATVDNDSRWIELFRTRTPVEFLQPLYLLLNFALRVNDGEPSREQVHEFRIDYVEVLQHSKQLSVLHTPFERLPTLSSEVRSNFAVECYSGLPSELTDVRYMWHVDGYPRQNSRRSTFLPLPADVGKTLRCLVRASGAMDQPEAWSQSEIIL